MNCTVVLSYQKDSPEREKNFNLNKTNLKNLNIPFIVSEQIPTNDTKKIEFDSKSNYLHIKYYSTQLFEKSKLYNLAISKSKTDYIWFLDCDVFAPYLDIIKRLSGDLVYRPFGKVYELDKYQSKLYLDGFDYSLDYQHNPYCQVFGKHSFIVHSSLFSKGLKFDEGFIGWGWEDLDFSRVKLKDVSPIIFSDLIGFHLFHPESNNINSRSNYNLYLKNLRSQDKLCYCFFINKFSDEDLYNLKDTLDSHLILSKKISFIFYFTGEVNNYNKIINNLSYKDFKILNYLNKNSKLKVNMHLNNCIYLSDDTYFCLLNNSFKVPLNVTMDFIKNQNLKSFSVKDFHFFSRINFNSFSGLKENCINSQISILQKDIKSDSNNTNISNFKYWNLNETYNIKPSGKLEKISI